MKIWQPIATAPRDGTLMLLAVESDPEQHDCNPLEDTENLSRTIGFNNFDNDGEDAWHMAGWCWSHDHFTEGRSTPKYWMPIDPAPAYSSNPTTADSKP